MRQIPWRQWLSRIPPETAVMAAAFCFLAAFTQPIFSNTATSRLATVYSLAERQTWRIDVASNPFEPVTVDKVLVQGRLISSKPPVFSLLMTGEFLALKALTGWHLDRSGDAHRVLHVFTFTFSGLPYLFGLVCFAWILRRFRMAASTRLYLLVALAFGTQFGGYATTFNNHVPAAALVLASFACVQNSERRGGFVLLGLTSALAFTLDMPTAILTLPMWAYAFAKTRGRALGWTLLGAAAPLALHFALTVWLTGSPLPVQVSKAPFLFESSYWRQPAGRDALHEPKGTYLFHLLFGRSGIFLLYPVLLLGPLGLLTTRRRARAPKPALMACAALGLALFVLYYAAISNNYGGVAYGGRWFIPAMPLLLLAGARQADSWRRWQPWAGALALLAISIYSTWACVHAPWTAGHEWTVRLFGQCA